MRRRRVWWIAGGVVLVAAVVAVLLLTRPSVAGPYVLSAWEYGAIAWVDPSPDHRADRAVEASRLFVDVFALWGYEPPEPVEGGRVAKKADPAGGASVDLRALEWKGALLPPLVVLVFPDEESLAEATGMDDESVTFAYGVAPETSFGDEPPEPVSEWLADLTGASIAFVCTADRWEELFVGEAAKWMLGRAMEIPELCECTPYGLPRLIREGIAGFSAGRLLGGEDRVAAATAWAETNGLPTGADVEPLVFDVDTDTITTLGTSFIAYLVEEHGTDGLASAICNWHSGSSRWCRMSESRTLLYLRGWRAFLGVEEE